MVQWLLKLLNKNKKSANLRIFIDLPFQCARCYDSLIITLKVEAPPGVALKQHLLKARCVYCGVENVLKCDLDAKKVVKVAVSPN